MTISFIHCVTILCCLNIGVLIWFTYFMWFLCVLKMYCVFAPSSRWKLKTEKDQRPPDKLATELHGPEPGITYRNRNQRPGPTVLGEKLKFGDRWVVIKYGTCAVILTPTADFVAESYWTGSRYSWIQGRGSRIYSCYNSRNDCHENFAKFLDEIHQSVSECDARTHALIGGFKALSQKWGSHNDQRGEQLSDIAASLNRITENSGFMANYRRINAESVIDVTFSSLVVPATVRGSLLLDQVESASDHRYIKFTLYPTPDADDISGNLPRGC